MSIFGRTSTGIVSVPVYESYSHEVNGHIIAMQESFDDHLAIIESLHALDMQEYELRHDLQHLSESQAEACIEQFEVVRENMVKDAWKKIKEMLSKLWGKIKSFYESVKRFFVGLFASGKKFVEKYEKQLLKLDLSGYKYTMFNYTISNQKVNNAQNVIDELIGNTASTINNYDNIGGDKVIEEIKEQLEKNLQVARAEIVNASGNFESDEFRDLLFRHFRDGAKDPEEISVDIKNIIKVLKDSTYLSSIESSKNTSDKWFSNALKDIGKFEKEAKKNVKSEDIQENESIQYTKHTNTFKVGGNKQKTFLYNDSHEKALGENLFLNMSREYASAVSKLQSDYNLFISAWKDAYKEMTSVYKKVCVSAFRYKKQ